MLLNDAAIAPSTKLFCDDKVVHRVSSANSREPEFFPCVERLHNRRSTIIEVRAYADQMLTAGWLLVRIRLIFPCGNSLAEEDKWRLVQTVRYN